MNHIKDIASGDFFSLNALYKEHHTKVYRLSLCILRDPFLANEATQETFLRIQRNADCYSPVISETAFLIAITRLLCFDILNKRAALIPEYKYTDKKNPPSIVNFRNDFMDFLPPLPEHEQEILCLYFLYELNEKEIGMILNKTPRVIKRMYQQALQRLSIEYKGREGSDAAIE